MKSMTGFGRVSGQVGTKLSATIAAKSVNHRYLEVSVRLPESLWEFESAVRALAAERFSRGKIDVSVRTQRPPEAAPQVTLNRRVAESLVPQLQAMASDLGLSQVAGGDLLRLPDLIQVDTGDAALDE